MIPLGIATTMREALELARHFTEIASDWSLNEMEVDGEIYSVYDVQKRLDAALQYLDTLPAAPAPDWSKAPEWATHHVYNCMGSGLWLSNAVVVDTTWASGWRRVLRQTMDGHTDYSGYQLPIGIDWRTTLVARPTEDK